MKIFLVAIVFLYGSSYLCFGIVEPLLENMMDKYFPKKEETVSSSVNIKTNIIKNHENEIIEKEESDDIYLIEDFTEYDATVIYFQNVNSSCFSSVGYDEDNCALGLIFNNSSSKYIYVYTYYSYDDYYKFINSASLGSYYNDYIKGKYPCYKYDINGNFISKTY